MKKQAMLTSVESYLSLFGKPDKKVLEAIEKVDRKSFMPFGLKNQAYLDTAMPIGNGQTISQPSTVARMLQLLELKKGDIVLEIGTGSGWNASLISFLIGKKGKIISLEIVKELIEKAKEKIKKKSLKNIQIKQENFLKIKQKFDKIIFTAGISFGKERIIEKFAHTHLKEKGILICPFKSGPLIILKKQKNKIKKTYTREEYRFVPLIIR